MKNEILFIANSKKLDELVPEARWAAQCWLSDCWNLDLQFRVSEVYRTQERQNLLILIGRDSDDDFWRDYQSGKMTLSTAHRGIALLKKYGPFEEWRPPVTWTLDSEHIQRIAADIYPLNCTHADITAIAKRYGITHPWPKNDPPHYSFGNAKKKPEPVRFRAPASLEEAIRKLTRQLKNKKPGVAYDRFKARLEELQAKK